MIDQDFRWLALACVVALAGCGGDSDGDTGADEDGSSGTEGGTTQGTTGTSATAGSQSGTTASTSESTGMSSVDDTSAGSGDTTASTSGGSSDGGTDAGSEGSGTGGLACDPNAEDMCIACLGEVCCDELTACSEDPACACMAECIGSGEMPGPCLGHCGLMKPPQSLDPVIDCMLMMCPDADECGA